MTQAERIRKYYKDNPSASYDEVAEKTGISKATVRRTLARDVNSGFCSKTEDGIDYSTFFKNEEERHDLIEWKNYVRRELIDQLLEAGRREKDSDKVRLIAKAIDKLLNEVNQ